MNKLVVILGTFALLCSLSAFASDNMIAQSSIGRFFNRVLNNNQKYDNYDRYDNNQRRYSRKYNRNDNRYQDRESYNRYQRHNKYYHYDR